MTERPKQNDPEVIEYAVSAILPEVMLWLANGGDSSKESEVRGDLSEVLRFASDGYELCRQLEKHSGWDCNRELVDILDCADLWSAHRELERRWVSAYRVFPALAVGAQIAFKGHPAEISKIDLGEGKYTIFCSALGHVRNGPGTYGEIVAWEKIDGKINAPGLTITGPLFANDSGISA